MSVTYSTGIATNGDYLHIICLFIILAVFGLTNVIAIRTSSFKPPHTDLDLDRSYISEFPSDGGNFAKGIVDLGGLVVAQSSEFEIVCEMHKGGPDDMGAKFYKTTALPDGYFMLGHYAHSKNKALSSRVLVVRDDGNGAVAKPVRYTLLWNSEYLDIKQNGTGYVWQPVPPKGYMALGHIVTSTSEMPSLDEIRCVRFDFVEECSTSVSLWGEQKDGVRIVEGKSASNVAVGTFKAAAGYSDVTLVHCLKNNKADNSCMPNMDQIKKLMTTYGPLVYLNPDEKYFPSSVDWFFKNGALLYQRGNEANPVGIGPTGSNLPQNGVSDGSFWIDLPEDENVKDQIRKGDLGSARVYLHVKPMLGGTMTDLAIWLFYPYNGPATAKILFVNINLTPIGEHVGDWEHVTLRINNMDGKLQSVYFAEHRAGQWVSASELEYTNENKPIAYSSYNGHAMFPHEGLVVQGGKQFGMRNDMAKSDLFIDTGANFEIVSADYLGIIEPPWLNYFREWGPKVNYNIQDILNTVEEVLIFKKLKKDFENFVNRLPSEILRQEGPSGPKEKVNWNGDEVVR